MVDAIRERRSVRQGFRDQAVPEEMIEEIIACGLASPSSKNAQPWRLHVVTNRQVLGELADAVQHARFGDMYVPIDPATGEPRPDWPSTVSESASVLRAAPLGLFIENLGCFSGGRHNIAVASDDVREDALIGYGLEMIGHGAVIQSMWLAGVSMGLVGVFMGDVLIAEPTIRERLGMEQDLVGVLALGFGETGAPPKRLAADRVVRHR